MRKKLVHIAFLLIPCFIIGFIPLIVNGQNHWKAGVARIKITPTTSLWMAGYAARTQTAEGKLHDLWAKALYLEDAQANRALLVTTDILGYTRDMSEKICRGIMSASGIERSQIILSSTHTHSGPVLTDALTDIYPMNAEQWEEATAYTDWLVQQIIELAAKAMKHPRSVVLSSSNGAVRFQVNRRNNKASTLHRQTSLAGPNDYAVPVLRVADEKGKIMAIVFGYACHPTTLFGYKWSGDYAGIAQMEIEKMYKGTNAMFFQGAGADHDPIPRGSLPLAVQYGKELAAAVERTLAEEMQPLLPQLQTAYNEISLMLNPPPLRMELETMKTQLKRWERTWAVSMLKRIDRGENLISEYPYPVQMWNLGGQLMAALGGELLVDYSIQLKKIFGDNLFVMGYANDVMGYIPSETVLAEGGYEGRSSHKVYGLPNTWNTGIQEQILREVVRMAKDEGMTDIPDIETKANKIISN
ncbi:neutral/alkaline non-lysosomal ceramidase N-terminal domain-containing protein [Gaoshiqia sp. Z1-71]|uniref:neutral/alkaline non-lysosomal ceramidase N-terminal domain-containing protein n=1 Tax=Gaoshiqia hydrogeniformans TaxID=3290090 RepID=UPI003BF83312